MRYVGYADLAIDEHNLAQRDHSPETLKFPHIFYESLKRNCRCYGNLLSDCIAALANKAL